MSASGASRKRPSATPSRHFPLKPSNYSFKGKSTTPNSSKHLSPFNPSKASRAILQSGTDDGESSTATPRHVRVRNDPESVADSLYSLSVGITDLRQVLKHILYFRAHVPFGADLYGRIKRLLYASERCPNDAAYLLLTIPAKMLMRGIPADADQLIAYIKMAKDLLSSRKTFESFGNNQRKPRVKLQGMISLFQKALDDLSRLPKKPKGLDTFGTKTIDKYASEVDSPDGTRHFSDSISSDDIELPGETDFSVIDDEKEPKFKAVANPRQEQDLLRFSSVDRFLMSSEDKFQRRDRGMDLFRSLSASRLGQIHELLALFSSWEEAYNASSFVWKVMKEDNNFDVDVLISQLPLSFADYLIEALKTFAKQEGRIIPDLHPPSWSICE